MNMKLRIDVYLSSFSTQHPNSLETHYTPPTFDGLKNHKADDGLCKVNVVTSFKKC